MTWVSTDNRLPTEADADECKHSWGYHVHSRMVELVHIGAFAEFPATWSHWHPKPKSIPPEPPVDEETELCKWAWETFFTLRHFANHGCTNAQWPLTGDGMLEVIEAMRERGYLWSGYTHSTGEHSCTFGALGRGQLSRSELCDSLPLATLKAARRALG